MKFCCARCGKAAGRPAGDVNRSRAAGMSLYCGRKCAGAARRKSKTKAQKVAEKRAYDMEYRRKNRAILKAKKHAHHLRTYDPEKARVERKAKMPRHVEYCRRPEYKRWKAEYDRQYRAREFGAFAEAYRLTIDLNREIKGRMATDEIKSQNQTANKAQFRRRATSKEAERSRPLFRDRRDRHQAPVG